MTDQQRRMIARSERLQREGKARDAIKLRILAGELKTVRYGPEIQHDTH